MMAKHTDHATWVSFSTEEMAMLREILLAVPSELYSYAEAAEGLLSKLDQYESPESKDQRFRDAAQGQSWVRDGECGQCEGTGRTQSCDMSMEDEECPVCDGTGKLPAGGCADGMHSWVDQVGKLPADTKCDHCGELYGDPPTDRAPVPFATVEVLAKNIRELRELEQRKAATQAELIRWCVHCLRTTPEQCAGVRRAEGFTASNAARRAHVEDQKKALLYLEWLATSLENQTVRSPDNN